MSDYFSECLEFLVSSFRQLEAKVEQPIRVSAGSSFVFRFRSQSYREALIQKLARYISGLHAVQALLQAGLAQEQRVIERTLDEFLEDIFFLAFPMTGGDATTSHAEYLEAFYYDPYLLHPSNPEKFEKRHQVKRSKIQSYLRRQFGSSSSGDLDKAIFESLSVVYSGFVHAASPNIMDMYGGDPPRFHVSGLPDPAAFPHMVQDAWNYFYRGLLALAAVAKAFGEAELDSNIEAFIDSIARRTET